MRLSILVILLTVSQLVQSQVFTLYTAGSSDDVIVECRAAIYEDTTFVGYWLEDSTFVKKVAADKYIISLETNTLYNISCYDKKTNKLKTLFIGTSNIDSNKNLFSVTADFTTTDELSVMYSYKTKMYLFNKTSSSK